MRVERWFISYKCVVRDFLTQELRVAEDRSVVTDVTPARWLLNVTLKTGAEHHILYAEKISPALASELVHGGAGIIAGYFEEGISDD